MANVSSSNGLEKYPKLRFKGFTEPWNAIRFGDIVDEYSDRTKEEDEDILLSAAIEGMFLNSELFDHQRGVSNKGYKKVDMGTLVLSTQNLHLGNANVNLRFEHGMVSPAYKTYHIHDCSIGLIAEWVKSEKAKRFFYDATTVGASVCRRNVEWDTLYDQSLYLPSEAEQERLATFLTALTTRIKKQTELVEHLKKYKRGVLKAILEQRLRFKRSNGENYPKWESYTISEITDCLDRRRVPITSNERIKGAYPYYGANGIQDYVADYIFDGEFVLLAEDGGHFNDFATEPIAQYVSGKIWVNNHAHILQAKCNTHFLFYALVHKDIRNYINNPSRGKLNQEDMQGIVIDVPCKEEQERIVDFMLKIDQNIEAKLNTLNQLVDFKKGLLQQLFI